MTLSPATLDELGQYALRRSQKRLDDKTDLLKHVITDVRNRASKHKLTYIGHGSNRIVFETPDGRHAIKLAINTSSREGQEQNRVEAYLWDGLSKHAHSSIRERFFPVIASDDAHKWLVMPAAEYVEEDREFDSNAAVTSISRDFPNLHPDSEFLLTENIGWNPRMEQYGLLDYGTYIPESFVNSVLPAGAADQVGQENIATRESSVV